MQHHCRPTVGGKINNEYAYFSQIGADVPIFLYGKNALVTGMGEKIAEQTFPKYYFLLVKPEINLSTKKMYEEINSFISLNKLDPTGDSTDCVYLIILTLVFERTNH